jgi:DNA-binding CsgD family transcriptional regulator
MPLEAVDQATTVRVGTFSSFMQYLTTFPEPDSAAQAMSRGPLSQFGCERLSIWTHLDYKELISIGYHGSDPEVAYRYLRLPLTLLTPATHAFVGSTTVILPVGEVLNRYPELRVDQDAWDLMEQQMDNGDLVAVPIIANGAPIGAFAFLCDRQNNWNLRNTAFLDGLSAALSLWMSHPNSRAQVLPQNAQHAQLALTPRQMEILSLVQERKSNASISAHLGFSESTIKQELQRVMKRLGVRSREHAVARCLEMQLIPLSRPLTKRAE